MSGDRFSVGGAIGPVLGGLMLQYFWWGSVFLLAVPVMVLLLVLGPLLLPDTAIPAAGRLDLRSAGLSLLAVLAAIYGMKEWARTASVGWRSPRSRSVCCWGSRSCAGSNGWTSP